MCRKGRLVSGLFLGFFSLTGCGQIVSDDLPIVLLEFPFADPSQIMRMAAFNTPDWGEPGVFHNGIDLIIDTYDHPQMWAEPVQIIAPAGGVIREIRVDVNPYCDQEHAIFGIIISVNRDMTAILALEPLLGEGETHDDQLSLIVVGEMDRVSVGDEIAGLLDGKEQYSHLHYMLEYKGEIVSPYDYSTQAAKDIFDAISERTGEPVNYAP